MAYSGPTATLALLPGFPQTTTSAGYTSTVTMLQDQVIRADSVIDGYLSRRFTIPVNGANTFTAAVPPLVRTLSQELTSAYVYRSYYTRDNVATSEYADQREKWALGMLEKISDMESDLFDTAGALITERISSARMTSTTRTYAPTFDEGPVTGWLADPDKLSDISADK